MRTYIYKISSKIRNLSRTYIHFYIEYQQTYTAAYLEKTGQLTELELGLRHDTYASEVRCQSQANHLDPDEILYDIKYKYAGGKTMIQSVRSQSATFTT